MATLTFEVEVHFDDDCSLVTRPDKAKVTISTLDVLTWLHWTKVIKAENLYKVEAWDHRCVFYNEVEPFVLEENTEFRQEAARVVVDDGGVCFEGFEKGGNTRTGWSTEELTLEDLAKQLCE